MPAYKQLKGYGSATPFIEGVLGDLLQAAKDSAYRTDLNLGQRLTRATIVGAENYFTDIISETVGYTWGVPLGAAVGGGATSTTGPGMAGGLSGGALAGKVFVTYLVNRVMDNLWNYQINPWAFKGSLGNYP